MDLNNHRLQTILFKCAVGVEYVVPTPSPPTSVPTPIHTRELRAYAVDEVKRTNGRVSFESAVRQQRRIEYEQDGEDDFE